MEALYLRDLTDTESISNREAQYALHVDRPKDLIFAIKDVYQEVASHDVLEGNQDHQPPYLEKYPS